VKGLPRFESLESVETSQLFAEETQEKPYENLPPKKINSPMKKSNTSILTRPKRELSQPVSVAKELQKEKSHYLIRIKTNIAKKTNEEFKIRKNRSVPKMMAKMRTQKRENAFGSVYKKGSPPNRAHSTVENRNTLKNRSEIASITRD